MEIVGIVVLAVLSIPIGLFYALYRISRLESSLDEVRREVAALRRTAGGSSSDSARSPSSEPPRTADRRAERPAASRAAPYTETVAPDTKTAAPSEATEDRTPAGSPKPSTAEPSTRAGADERHATGPGADQGHAKGPGAATAGARSRPGGGSAPDSEGRRPLYDSGSRRHHQSDASSSAAGLDVEAAIGSTWLLRIGLGILAIALALFARLVAPQLSPMAKVVLAYAGALGFFGVGKVFEERLDRFAKPVMAGGLAFGFFVAFAAHFVPAMAAVSLPVSVAWMVVSMLSVLVAAERWRSESTAVLAIILGHVSAQVSAGAADMYSLVMIGFLATTALALLLRHGWVQLGLLGVVASYGAHLLWMLAERQAPAGNEGFWLSLAFLTSYYLIFLAADLLWWRREPDVGEGEEGARRRRHARALGPTNLVLYVSLTTFLYLASGAMVESVEWYYLILGALQGALARLYRGLDHDDYVFYPVFGTVLWTIGLFAALDALVLNLVLASQALLLLITAHRTGMRVFYLLAQGMMGAAFIHYVAYPPPDPGSGVFLGGVAIASVYLVKADLEERWYEIPLLPQLHAILGGIVLIREANAYLAFGGAWGAFVAATALVLTGLALARSRTTLLFGVSTMALGLLLSAGEPGHDPMWTASMGLLAAALVMLTAGPRVAGLGDSPGLLGHARTVATLVLLAALLAADGLPSSLTSYLLWMLIPLGVVVTQTRADTLGGKGESPDRIALLTYVVAGLLVLVVTAEATSSLMQPVWAWVWASVAFGVFGWRRLRGLTVVGFTVLFGGALVFLNSSLLAVPELSGADHPALSSWLAATFLAVVPFAIGWNMDRHLGPPKGPGGLDGVDDLEDALSVFMPYFLGLLTVGAVAAQLGTLGWIYFAPAVAGVALGLAGRSRSMPRPILAAALGAAVWHLHFLGNGARAPGVASALLLLVAFAVLTLVVERMAQGAVGRADGTPDLHARTTDAGAADDGAPAAPGDDRPGAIPVRPLLVGLTILATITGMVAIEGSAVTGGPWTTVGWSVWAGLLMGAAFAVRSASYRRVALAVLVVCIGRVFVVDTVGLSDTARVGAFLILGLVLVGIALLYNRYSEELKSWL